MPFVFAIFGVVLIVSGVRGTVTGSNPNLVDLVKSDLTGQPNYTEWMVAILAVGAVGYIDDLKELSRAFMTLIVIGLLLSNKGFFSELEKQATSSDPAVSPAQPQSSIAAPSTIPADPTTGLAPLAALPELDPTLFE
jgi:hypothetical protein